MTAYASADRQPENITKKRVLVAPLDWGLGHASRCVPLIRALRNAGHEVVIASHGGALALLRQEFPTLLALTLPAYAPRYSRSGRLFTALFFQLPKFLWIIHQEHRKVAHIVSDHRINVVFADNRYGCWSKQVPSVFITHQLSIILPRSLRWAERLVRFFNHRQVRHFTHCWVPDYPDQSLSGRLSDPHGLSVAFVGPLTRFSRAVLPAVESLDIVALISGPEPQRSLFLTTVLGALRDARCRFRVVAGVPEGEMATEEVLPHLPSKDLQELILSSRMVICRSGYSSLMDLYELSKPMLLVPTPGQTEQIYLAALWADRGWATNCPQEHLSAAVIQAQLNSLSLLRPPVREKTSLETLISRVLADIPSPPAYAD